eukprot:Hpha_TRINITY_DN10582_c1_g1::TRINITY_DN10582_c1_g1_i1::g.31388::m.31388
MAGLLIYVRWDDKTSAVELDPAATVGDLKRAAAQLFPVVENRGLVHGDTVLSDDSLPLADAGFSSQITVEVGSAPLCWDLDKSSKTTAFEDDNQVANWTGTDGYCSEVVVATHGWTSGRHYWEVKLEVWDGSGSGRDLIGVCNQNLLKQLTIPGSNAGMGSTPHAWGAGMWQAPFRKEHNGDEPEFKGTRNPKQGDRIGILLDLDQMFVRWYLNGGYLGADAEESQLNDLPRGDMYYPAVSVGRLSAKHKYRIIANPEPPREESWKK